MPQPEECQLCTYDLAHCNGDKQKAATYECQSFRINSINLHKVTRQLQALKTQQQTQQIPQETKPMDKEHAAVKVAKAIYNIADLALWKLTH